MSFWFLNLWNKTCAGNIDIVKACEKSKYIMMMQKHVYEAYGWESLESKLVPPNQTVAISWMIELLVKTDIFGSH